MAKTEMSANADLKAKSKSIQKSKTKSHTEENSLKGTLVSVLLLGVFLIVTWFGVFALFLDRS